MNYLDEDTLVWDSSENNFVSKDTDMPDVKWHSVNAAQANIGSYIISTKRESADQHQF